MIFEFDIICEMQVSFLNKINRLIIDYVSLHDQ